MKTLTLKEFLAGKPVAYFAEDKRERIAVYKHGVGIGYVFGDECDIAKVRDDQGASRFYHQIKGVIVAKDDLEVPAFLKRKMTKEGRANMDEIVAETKNPTLKVAEGKAGRDFLQPKGVSDEEWEETKKRRAEEKKEKSEKRNKEKREVERSRKGRELAPDGYVHISKIAASIDMDPRDARAIMRSIMSKPACGWSFDPKEVDDIKAKLKAGGKEKVTKKTKKKMKIPGPEETTWSLSSSEKRKWKNDAKKRDEKIKEEEPKKKTGVSKAAKAKIKKK